MRLCENKGLWSHRNLTEADQKLPDAQNELSTLPAQLLATSATWWAALHQHHHHHHPHQLRVGRAVWLRALTQMNQARLPFWAESAGSESNHSTERLQQVAAWGEPWAAQSWPSPQLTTESNVCTLILSFHNTANTWGKQEKMLLSWGSVWGWKCYRERQLTTDVEEGHSAQTMDWYQNWDPMHDN